MEIQINQSDQAPAAIGLYSQAIKWGNGVLVEVEAIAVMGYATLGQAVSTSPRPRAGAPKKARGRS
jgi:hypothetical protein